MGKTIIQKIFESHSPGDAAVEPGNIVWLDLDMRSARDFAGANVVKNYRAHYGDAPVADKTRPASPSTWWCRPTTSPTPTTSKSAAYGRGSRGSRCTT